METPEVIKNFSGNVRQKAAKRDEDSVRKQAEAVELGRRRAKASEIIARSRLEANIKRRALFELAVKLRGIADQNPGRVKSFRLLGERYDKRLPVSATRYLDLTADSEGTSEYTDYVPLHYWRGWQLGPKGEIEEVDVIDETPEYYDQLMKDYESAPFFRGSGIKYTPGQKPFEYPSRVLTTADFETDESLDGLQSALEQFVVDNQIEDLVFGNSGQ